MFIITCIDGPLDGLEMKLEVETLPPVLRIEYSAENLFFASKNVNFYGNAEDTIINPGLVVHRYVYLPGYEEPQLPSNEQSN
jgi:hypothetical protein